MTNIIKDITLLQQTCEKIDSLEEAKDIADQLFKILKKSNNGVGLAANQIGINKAVCVVNIDKPIWFMNPALTPIAEEKVQFNEACLSFPDIIVTTERYKNVLVAADNYENFKFFGGHNILECVCVQHEICHLNGETMFDYEVKSE
jgi:peptide deformylase